MHIYLETSEGSNRFKYRGETDKTDNPDSFSQKMGLSGLRVIQKKAFAGLEIKDNVKPIGVN